MATKKPTTVKGRVLMDGTWGRVNQIIDILPDQVEAAEQSGQVDTHPDAVAYAENLKAE